MGDAHVVYQHRPGHRADSARHWGDKGGHLGHRSEVHVSAQSSLLVAVYADINDYSARLDHVHSDEPGLPYRRDQDICLAADVPEVLCLGMADRPPALSRSRLS